MSRMDRINTEHVYQVATWINRLLEQKESNLRIEAERGNGVWVIYKTRADRPNLGVDSTFRYGLSTREAYEALLMVEKILEAM